MDFITSLPSCLSCEILSQWIDLKDIARLDSALCDKNLRPTFLDLFMSTECVIETKMKASGRIFLRWLLNREVKARYFSISSEIEEDLAEQYIKKYNSHVATIFRKAPTFAACLDFGLDVVIQALNYGHLNCLQCDGISGSFLSEILYHNQSLQELHVSMIDWENIDSLDAKCASITGLYFSGDEEVALDVISLCPNLRKLEVNFICTHGDDADSTLIAIAEKSRQIRYLALPRVHCNLPAYTAMTTLCTDIVNLDISLSSVTDEVIESVAINLKNLRRLNGQDCYYLTNTSLCSLATHRASTLEYLSLGLTCNITSDAIVSLKNTVPGLYVHWQLTLEPMKGLQVVSTDYAVCTVLYSFWSTQDTLLIALRCKLLTVLCVFDQKRRDIEFTIDNMTQLVRCCPQLRTIIVRDSDLQAIQAVVVQFANYITVTSSTACLSASLQDFPI